MDNSGALSHDEKISWIMNLLNCENTNDYYAVMEKLHPLKMDDLDKLDRYSSKGAHRADCLRKALLSEYPVEDVLLARPYALEYEQYHDIDTMFDSVLDIIANVRKRGLSMENLRVHVIASIRCVFVSHSGMRYDESGYTVIPGMMELVEEFPDRMVEITDLRVRRKTNDVKLIREAMKVGRPLCDGAL